MKISIIIPIYNTKNYLEKCLNSVINQKFQNIEIICVNDCSTDDSLMLLEHYQKKDDRIIIINNKKNVGLSETRNKGLEIASGEYIMFIDSDDYIVDNSLEELYYKIKDKDLDVLFFGYHEHFIKKEVIKDMPGLEYYPQITSGKNFFCKCQKNNNNNVTSWSAIYKCEFLRINNLKFVKDLLHEDVLFYFEILMKAKKVSSIGKCYYEYIRRENSITLSNNNFQAKIWSLSKIICRINSYNDHMSDYLKYNINGYLLELIKAIRCYYKKLQYFDMKKYPLCPEVDFIVKAVGINFYNGFFSYKLPLEVVENIKKYKEVIIYGAGKVGQGLCELLREYQIYTTFFVQTNINSSKKKIEFYGIEIKAIDALNDDKNKTIILIANKKNSQEMYNYAMKLGFKNVIDVSEYI